MHFHDTSRNKSEPLRTEVRQVTSANERPGQGSVTYDEVSRVEEGQAVALFPHDVVHGRQQAEEYKQAGPRQKRAEPVANRHQACGRWEKVQKLDALHDNLGDVRTVFSQRT